MTSSLFALPMQDQLLEDYDGPLADKVVVPVEKHLPGKHDQQTHGQRGVAHSPVKDNDPKTAGELAQSRHIKRERGPDEPFVKTMKDGSTKTIMRPTYKFFDSITGKEIYPNDDDERKLWNKAAPPGVNEVRINPNPNGHVVSTWVDVKGRSHTNYSKKHDQAGHAEKFARLEEFNSQVRKLRGRIKRDLDSSDPRIREAAAALYLIDQTGFRVGNDGDTKGDVQAYGATTLLGKHVSVNGNKVSFDFIGKEGVRIRKTVTDSLLAKIINDRKTAAWSQPIFDTTDGRVRSYLKSIDGDFSPKDFRTWHGTAKALEWIKKRRRSGPAPTEKVFNKWQKEVAIKVAKHLGNTPGIAMNSYINPTVWDVWRKPEWGPWVPKKLRE